MYTVVIASVPLLIAHGSLTAAAWLVGIRQAPRSGPRLVTGAGAGVRSYTAPLVRTTGESFVPHGLRHRFDACFAGRRERATLLRLGAFVARSAARRPLRV
jgi:hypothetical protein